MSEIFVQGSGAGAITGLRGDGERYRRDDHGVPHTAFDPPAGMEQLSDFRAGDEVSGVLRAIRLRSTMYCRSTMGAPWGFGVEAHGNPAFHLLAAGRCWLEVEGEGDQLELTTGDLVVLPTGSRHWLRDHPETPTAELEEILACTPLDAQRRLRHGGAGPRTTLLCGGFALEGGHGHALLRALAPVIHIRGRAGHPAPWVAATVGLLRDEVASNAPGAEVVVNRLAEALLIQALREGLAEMNGTDGGRVLALRDAQIASAIELVHRQPDRAWTVGGLAGEVALSRSAFAARFHKAAGESPKRYITRARLAHAATLLQSSDASLADIAMRAGYATEFSFSKAFKRTFGLAPGAYRGHPDPPALDLAAEGIAAVAAAGP